MRAWRLHGYGNPAQKLRLDHVDEPQPGPTDLQVRVQAVSLNPIDYKLAQGKLRVVGGLQFPQTMGFDLCGIVQAVGSAVSGFRPGQRVYARSTRQRLGAFAEIAVIDAAVAALAPTNLSAVEAASIPLVGLTTVQGLVDRAQVQAGQSLLVQAGSGGVGSFAVQYGKHLGLEVTATCSSANAARVRALGADRVICYDQQTVKASGLHFDTVYDTLGGAATLQAFNWLKPGGAVVSIAGPPDRGFARQVGAGPLKQLLFGLAGAPVRIRARLGGYRYFRFLTESRGAQLAALADLYQRAVLRPVIDREFAFEQMQEAWAYLMTGHARGKVVLRVAPD